MRLLAYNAPAVAVVDVGLPDGSGLELVARVRAADGVATRYDARLPLLVLSGRCAEIDRVRCFERGADDFVAKPFSYAELRLRLAALLRRTRERAGSGPLRVGDLAVDPATREVRLRGRRIELPGREFALLQAHAAAPTRVFTQEEIERRYEGAQKSMECLLQSRTMASRVPVQSPPCRADVSFWCRWNDAPCGGRTAGGARTASRLDHQRLPSDAEEGHPLRPPLRPG
jgi:DNA-binding response OmpR family regulator